MSSSPDLGRPERERIRLWRHVNHAHRVGNVMASRVVAGDGSRPRTERRGGFRRLWRGRSGRGFDWATDLNKLPILIAVAQRVHMSLCAGEAGAHAPQFTPGGGLPDCDSWDAVVPHMGANGPLGVTVSMSLDCSTSRKVCPEGQADGSVDVSTIPLAVLPFTEVRWKVA